MSWFRGERDSEPVGHTVELVRRGSESHLTVGHGYLPSDPVWIEVDGQSTACAAHELEAIRARLAGDNATFFRLVAELEAADAAALAAFRAEQEEAERVAALVASTNAPEDDAERAAQAAHAHILRPGVGRQWARSPRLPTMAVDLGDIAPWVTRIQEIDPCPVVTEGISWVAPDPDGGCMSVPAGTAGATPARCDWGAIAALAAEGVAVQGGVVWVRHNHASRVAERIWRIESEGAAGNPLRAALK